MPRRTRTHDPSSTQSANAGKPAKARHRKAASQDLARAGVPCRRLDQLLEECGVEDVLNDTEQMISAGSLTPSIASPALSSTNHTPCTAFPSEAHQRRISSATRSGSGGEQVDSHRVSAQTVSAQSRLAERRGPASPRVTRGRRGGAVTGAVLHVAQSGGGFPQPTPAQALADAIADAQVRRQASGAQESNSVSQQPFVGGGGITHAEQPERSQLTQMDCADAREGAASAPAPEGSSASTAAVERAAGRSDSAQQAVAAANRGRARRCSMLEVEAQLNVLEALSAPNQVQHSASGSFASSDDSSQPATGFADAAAALAGSSLCHSKASSAEAPATTSMDARCDGPSTACGTQIAERRSVGSKQPGEAHVDSLGRPTSAQTTQSVSCGECESADVQAGLGADANVADSADLPLEPASLIEQRSAGRTSSHAGTASTGQIQAEGQSARIAAGEPQAAMAISAGDRRRQLDVLGERSSGERAISRASAAGSGQLLAARPSSGLAADKRDSARTTDVAATPVRDSGTFDAAVAVVTCAECGAVSSDRPYSCGPEALHSASSPDARLREASGGEQTFAACDAVSHTGIDAVVKEPAKSVCTEQRDDERQLLATLSALRCEQQRQVQQLSCIERACAYSWTYRGAFQR